MLALCFNVSLVLEKGRVGHVNLPSNQPPVLFYPSAQRNFLSNLGTRRACQTQASCISLHCDNLRTCRRTADVDHQDFILAKLRNFRLFAVCSLHTQ